MRTHLKSTLYKTKNEEKTRTSILFCTDLYIYYLLDVEMGQLIKFGYDKKRRASHYDVNKTITMTTKITPWFL